MEAAPAKARLDWIEQSRSQMMKPDDTSADQLAEFKKFVYQSYEKSHPVFGAEASVIGRSAPLEPLLRKGLPADTKARILDFGCGDGVLLSVAEKLGYGNLVGIDLSQALIERARRRTSAELHFGDGMDYLRASPDGAFDAIIAFDVFEHLTRPELLATSREIVRALAPGGRLLLRVPNGASPFFGDIFYGDITHERPYTKESLTMVLAPLGFENIEAMEVAPVPHGLKSTIRAILWKLYRSAAILRMATETGSFEDRILTANMFLTARKAGG
jgi:SAM-dependent methyltransferase